jgi:hypothetical protein
MSVDKELKKYNINRQKIVSEILPTDTMAVELIEIIQCFLKRNNVPNATISYEACYSDGDEYINAEIYCFVDKTKREILKEIKEAEKAEIKRQKLRHRQYENLKKEFGE